MFDDPQLLRKSLKKVRRGGAEGEEGALWGQDRRERVWRWRLTAPTLSPTCLPEQEQKHKAKKAQAWQERLKQQAEQQQSRQQK